MPEMAAELPSAGGQTNDEMPAMSFLEHLEELRRRIIYSLIAVAVGFFACWAYAERIYEIMQKPIITALHANGMSEKLVYLNPTEPFNLYLKVAFMAGVVVGSPLLVFSGCVVFFSFFFLPDKRAFICLFFFSVRLLFFCGV